MSKTTARVVRLTPAQGARKLLKRRCRALRENARRVRHKPDPERLHDFRVALRKTRTLLTFSERAGLTVRRPTKSALRELAAASGALRDCEITRQQLAQFWGELDPADEWFVRECEVLLDISERRAAKDLRAILHEHRQALKARNGVEENREAASARDTLQGALARHLLALLREMEEHSLSLAEQLHALRIAVKNLRYTLEVVAGKRDRELLEDLKRVQTHLGVIHDLDHTIDVLQRWLRQRVHPASARSGELLGVLLAAAARVRAARIEEWQCEFPANGAAVFAKLQVRAEQLAARGRMRAR
jgi:CHAD domain-containing protein